MSTERALIRLGSRSTRRSVLAKGRRLLLGLAGLAVGSASLAEITPSAASHNCGFGAYCGLNGIPCKHCFGSETACPCTWGNAWSQCCYITPIGWFLISYVDCCGTCASCSGTWCSNSSAPNWCDGAGGNNYICTGIFVGDAC